MPARLGRFQDILSCDKVSQHTFCSGTICRAKIRCSWVLMVGHFVPVMSLRVMTYCPRAKRRSGILLLAPPSQPSHTVSHVTLLVSGGKFASRLDFARGRCFCSGRIPSIGIHFCPKKVIFESAPKVVAIDEIW